MLLYTRINQSLRATLILFVLALMAGCNSVIVDKPFGDVPSEKLVKSLAGTWIGADAHVFFIEAGEKGNLTLAMTQWSPEEEKFESQNLQAVLRLVGKRPLLFFPNKEGSEKYGFGWLTGIGTDTIYLRTPDAKVFRESVEEGLLEGKVVGRKNNHYDVHLRFSETLSNRLSASEGEKYFEPPHGDAFSRLRPKDRKK